MTGVTPVSDCVGHPAPVGVRYSFLLLWREADAFATCGFCGARLPLGCALARGPREALALFDALHPSDEDGTLAWQVLVSLPVRLKGGSLHEPVSDLWLDVSGIRPPVLARTSGPP